MRTHPFSLVLRLRSPLIATGRAHLPTLDALLAAARWHETGGDLDAILDLPLVCDDGLFRASCPILLDTPEAPLSRTGIRFTRGLKPTDLESAEHVDFGGRKQVQISNDEYKSTVDKYPALTAGMGKHALVLRYHGYGDSEACRELLQHFLPGVGKRAMRGAGEIGEVCVRDEAVDQSVMDPDSGLPVRPVPVRLWRGAPELRERAVMATWRPSYFWTNPEPCVVPEPCRRERIA